MTVSATSYSDPTIIRAPSAYEAKSDRFRRRAGNDAVPAPKEKVIFLGVPGSTGIANATPAVISPDQSLGLTINWVGPVDKVIEHETSILPASKINEFDLFRGETAVTSATAVVGVIDKVTLILQAASFKSSEGKAETFLSSFAKYSYGFSANVVPNLSVGMLHNYTDFNYQLKRVAPKVAQPKSADDYTVLEDSDGKIQFESDTFVINASASDRVNTGMTATIGHKVPSELSLFVQYTKAFSVLGQAVGIDLAAGNRRAGVGLNTGNVSLSYNYEGDTNAHYLGYSFQFGASTNTIGID